MLEGMGRHRTCETSVAVTVRVAAHGEKTGSATAAAYHQPGQASYRRLVLALFAAGVATFAALYSTQPLLGVLAQRFAIPRITGRLVRLGRDRAARDRHGHGRASFQPLRTRPND